MNQDLEVIAAFSTLTNVHKQKPNIFKSILD